MAWIERRVDDSPLDVGLMLIYDPNLSHADSELP